jgi:hypothetical protein
MAESPQLDLTDLAVELEREPDIREHLRKEGVTLFDKDVCSESVKSCSEDVAHAVLKALCLRMASTEGMPQPPVNPLRAEIQKLYGRCGAMTDEKAVYEDSWMVRKLCSFVKIKTRKQLVSTVTCPNKLETNCVVLNILEQRHDVA